MKKKIKFSLTILFISTVLLTGWGIEQQLANSPGKEKIDSLNELAYENKDNAPQKCIDYANQALKLSQELHYPEGEAAALKHIGCGFRVLGDYNRAFQHIRQALEVFTRLGDSSNIADCVKETGIVYLYTGKYDTALEHFFNALRIAEETGDKEVEANSLNNIGIVYFSLKQFDKAREYYLKSLEKERETGNKTKIAHSLHNLGELCISVGDFDVASGYFNEALNIYEELGHQEGLSICYNSLGIVYAMTEGYDKSEKYFLSALKIDEASGSKWRIARALNNLGECYLYQKKYNNALEYLKKGLGIARETDNKEVVIDVYRLLSDLYTARGQFRKALEYQKLFFEANTTLFNERSSQQIAEIETRYNTLKKEKEIETLKQDRKIQKLRLSRAKIARNALILGLLLVLVIVGLLFKKYLYLFGFWKRQKYIGQFQLIEEIGSGGIGTVYKARNIRDKSDTVAIKVLKPELFRDESSRKRFKHEAAVIDKLEHPHIVNIFERGEYKEKLFIVMELLEGRTLDVKIAEEGPLGLDECVHIMIQIADALVLIHSKEIVHRDLKPANIMLIERGGDGNFVKLLDFGLARSKFQTRITKTGVLMGTLNYMAPEQLAHSHYSSASDIYSLGVTFYEMVTGKMAFPGETATDIMKQVLDRRPVEPNRFRPDIPTLLNDLIMTMLAKPQDRRPPIHTILTHLEKIHPPSSLK